MLEKAAGDIRGVEGSGGNESINKSMLYEVGGAGGARNTFWRGAFR